MTSLGFAMVALMTGALAAPPPPHEVHLLPVPRTGAYAATATSINNSGVVGVNYANLQNYIESGAYLCTPSSCTAIPRLHENPKFPRNGVYALNDSGVATGHSDDLMDGGFAGHAYTYDGTNLARIPGFDQDGCGGCSLESVGYGINNSGHVVGLSQTANGRTRAFIFRDGVMLEIGRLGGHDSVALGINSSDEVVGHSQVRQTQDTHAFLYRNGRTKDLGTLGGDYSGATAINDRGHIAGFSNLAPLGLTVPFLYKKGSMAPLSVPQGATRGQALALNEADRVVGDVEMANLERHAFLHDGAAAYDLNDMLSDADRAEWQIESAAGINDLGQIAATGRHRASGAVRAFLFSPVAAAAPR
jgi:probable HAF family extracellular repeat protein